MEIKIDYKADIELSKKLAFNMVKNRFSSKVIPDKKKFNKKKERRKNKLKIYHVD